MDHRVDASPIRWKFTTSEAKVTLVTRLHDLMSTLFRIGRLDQYRMRRKG